MSNGSFDINGFVMESRDILVNPDYFSTMKISGGITEPMIKAVIYGLLWGVFTYIWNILDFNTVSMSILGNVFGIGILLWAVIGAFSGLFVGGALLLTFSYVSKGNLAFEANLRVAAAVMIVLPLLSLIGFLSSINMYLGIGANVLIFLFSFWLIYKGMIHSLKAKVKQARITMCVFVAVFLAFMLVVEVYVNRINQVYKNFYPQEILKDLNKE